MNPFLCLWMSFVLLLPSFCFSQQTYRQAYQASKENGKPIIVFVSSRWCQPCQRFEKTLKTIDWSEFNYAKVELTRQRELADKLLAGDFVTPQLIIFRKDEKGFWFRRVIKGAQKKSEVEKFLNDLKRSMRTGRRCN